MRITLSAGALAFTLVTGITNAFGENASNPLSSVNNTDLRVRFYELTNDTNRTDYSIEGAYMVASKFKVTYDLHYWDTDVTGRDENDFESFHAKALYFPKEGMVGKWKYRMAVGAEWIQDFSNEDKGIGTGSDQIAPLAGIALMPGNGLVLIPLVQHFWEYNGPDVNQTAFRLIAIQPLPHNFWGKLDAKVPVDWEHDNDVPASAEVQIGKMFTPRFGTYLDGLVGIGSDRPYEWGVGLGVRFTY